MGNIISVSNHKGGVGKTTSTVNIGAALAVLGHSVLLIDLDPQANLSQSLGIAEGHEPNIYQNLRGEARVQPVNVAERLDIIPSSLDLSGAEVELAGEAGREYILEELLEPIKFRYDFILIDCPPSLGLLTINALTASNEVLIPIQPHYLAAQGLAKLVEVVGKVQKRLNKRLKVGSLLITLYDGRKVLNRDVLEALEGRFPNELLTTRIRENIALAEAPTQGLDIFRYAPKSNGAEDYLAAGRDLLSKQGKQSKH
jgi:chromosome partitioning protein